MTVWECLQKLLIAAAPILHVLGGLHTEGELFWVTWCAQMQTNDNRKELYSRNHGSVAAAVFILLLFALFQAMSSYSSNCGFPVIHIKYIHNVYDIFASDSFLEKQC